MRKLLLLIILFLSGLTAGAAVFVVTSNADSGPGTLRQALLDATANGNTERDYINFNLADLSEAGRTITLQTQLPDLSSNLIIDGSVQPGTAFNFTDAKVKIKTPQNNNAIIVFNGADLTAIAFYGLYIFDYSDNLLSRPDLKTRRGFNLVKCSDITIGAANKGNRITGFNTTSINIVESDRVKIKNNIIGIGDNNGISYSINNGSGGFNSGYSGTVDIIKCNNIELGGDIGEGNIIFTIVNFKFYQLTHSKVIIKSNNFLVYPDGVSTEWYFEYYNGTVFFSAIFSSDTKNTAESMAKEPIVDMDFSNNVTGCQLLIFRFDFINGTVNLTHNYFNVGRDGVTPIKNLTQIPPAQQPFSIQNCNAQFNFGSNDIKDKNYFNNVKVGVTAGYSPNIFLRYNQYSCVSDAAYHNYVSGGGYQLPTLSISSINITGNQVLLTGKATPNSLVDIYSSENCQTKCSIHNYIKTIIADAAGNWQVNTDNFGGIFYASATLNNQTSEFKTFEVNKDNINIQPMRCTNIATITGLTVPQGLSYYWTDYNSNIVSYDLNLNTNKTGDYRLVLGEGCITSDWFKVEDKRVSIYDAFATKTAPGCGSSNGSIKNLFVYDPLSKIASQTWTNSAGAVLGTKADLASLAPDMYTFTIKTTDGCTATYVMNMSPTTGPNITQTNANITPTNCGQSVGSITNITATGTGTLKYNWKNAQNQQVATTKELTGQPAGVYTLQVSDDTNCGPVYTSAITIPEVNGITMDETAATQTHITCAGSLATVSGIKVTGATTYQWFNNQGLVVGNAADLSTGSPGNYRLVVSNANGCNQTSKVYTIIQQTNTDIYGGLSKVLKDATCDLNNGSIQVLFTDNPAVLPKSYRWVNHSSGITVATTTTPILTGIDAGAYDIYATNSTGCERMLITYSIGRIPGLTVLGITAQVTDDQCGTATGSIKGVGAGGKTPLSFVWTDNKGAVVGTAIDLLKVKAGNYHLKVSDGSGCEQTLVYTIRNQNNILPAPVVSNLQLCGSGDAILSVSNTSAALSYRLYDAYTSETPIDEQVSGKFKINVKQGRSYYVSQFVGECESERIEVKITVGLSTINIANTFSPNGDGINDTWNITNIQNYPNGNVQIFTRAGQKVFESIGYSIPFDGRYNGKNLPMGTYYYIINLNSGCGLLSGSLTLIR